jgi:hypothetical protein
VRDRDDAAQLDDFGASLHVVGTADGHEHLRFDCFEHSPHYHERDPHRSLFEPTTARTVLGWRPSRRWADISAGFVSGAPPASATHCHEGARPA